MARRRNRIPRTRRALLAALGALALAAGVPAAGVTAIIDINPDQSSLDAAGNPPAGDPDGASGGRVNGLASVPGNNQIFYAASEWGGIYKSTDGGLNWARQDTHEPNATWDVEASSATQVYATSFFDGRAANSLGGINVSTDGGATWTHPATATPPAAATATYSCPAARRAEPSAFGIAIDTANANNVYVGTNCGLAISTDAGVTWNFMDPKRLTTPAGFGTANDVWDVVAQGNTIDVCGDDGHLRSTDGGANWTAGGALPTGRCSIAVSPDEAYVLLVAASDNNVYESDNGGTNWANLGAAGGSRIPFAETNQRPNTGGNNVFDAWTGGVSLFRGACTTPATPAPGGAARCPARATWAGPFTRTVGAHDDVGTIVFDTQAAGNACPEILSSDGGVYRNTDNGADCQNPDWEQPTQTPHALWLYTMVGVDRAGAGEDLYFGTQDNGSHGTITADAGTPTWVNRDCCDVFDFAADATRTVYTFFSPFRMFLRGANLAGGAQIAAGNVPPGTTPTFNFPDSIDQYGNNSYIAVTNTGAYITTDITAATVTWTQLGAASTPAGGFCGVQAAVTGGTPTFYAQTQCIGVFENSGPAQVWQYVGSGAAGTWTRIDNNDGVTGGFGIFAVDPNNPNRLYASNFPGIAAPRMLFSTDGGTNWDTDPELDSMMTQNGAFLYQNTRGPTSFTGFLGYAQPSLVAYDAEDASIMVAGGRDSGIFLSTDSGANWSLLTSPINPTVARPHLPRPWFAYFDHEPANTVSIYVGTQGRGVWRISLGIPTVSAGGPYTTNEGQDAALAATANDPDGQPLTFTWDFDNDGQFDDATGQNPTFDLVGQDGVFAVRVKVTDPDGAFRVASTTVTVENVAPSIPNLASDGPKPENSAIALSGVISDPGWLENLTGTVDWGDGAGAQPLAGTLENVRPDATLTFSVAHTYGDDGVFTVTVCGKDDDAPPQCSTISVTITNVAPSAQITAPASTATINGVNVVITNQGATVGFAGRSTDPGSDDLALSWDWDDGPPVPDVTTTYLNDTSVNPDPDPSPSINPRDVTDAKNHAFAACLYDVVFGAADDDSGVASDAIKVLVTGNATERFSAGYWQNVFRSRKSTPLTDAQIICYLKIAGFVSLVFNETTDASTIAKAYDVLKVGTSATAKEQFDRQLLAALINFANGEPDWNELIDTNGDSAGDTPFLNVIATAEAVRNNPTSTKEQIVAQKDLLEKINLGTA